MDKEKIIMEIMRAGGTVHDAANAVGHKINYVYKNFPEAISVYQKKRRLKKMALDAEIVETYVYEGNVSHRELAERMGLNEDRVRLAVSRYFERPNENLLLKSKV